MSKSPQNFIVAFRKLLPFLLVILLLVSAATHILYFQAAFQKRSCFEATISKDHEVQYKTKRQKITYLKTPRCKDYGDCGENICSHRPLKWTMMTFVKSAAANFERRKLIRQTWGTVNYVSGARFNVIFILGKAEEKVQKLVNEEHDRNGDILQANVPDNYSNIALKTLAGMQWASENLPDNYFYSTADDDFILNMGRVFDLVVKYRKVVAYQKWPTFPILCMFCTTSGAPQRNTTHKNFVSKIEYIWPYFPKYCLGGMYTTTVRVAGRLLYQARINPMNRNDDVWITGVLRHQLGMPDEMVIDVPPNTTAIHHQDLQAENYNYTEWVDILSYTFSGRFVCLTQVDPKHRPVMM